MHQYGLKTKLRYSLRALKPCRATCLRMDAQGGDVLRRALGTKAALRLHQRGEALPHPAGMEVAGTRARRARECLQ